MSTAGSIPSGDRATPLAPPTGPSLEPPPPQPTRKKRVAIFRWRGIFALLFGFAVSGVVWVVFGSRCVRVTLQDTAAQSLGTQVDVGRLKLDVVNTSVELRGLAVADPVNLTHNLVEANVVRAVLEPDALLQKKIVIRELTFDGVRTGTRRAVAARPMGDGFAPRALIALRDWRKQFQVPLLSLSPVDTIKSLVLDPTQLATVKRALELTGRADSLRNVLTSSVRSIPFVETADSAKALVTRLNGQTPRTLGLIGTRNAITDTRRLVGRVDSIHKRIDAVIALARAGADSLVAATRAVDDARRADFEFAKGLLKLPTVDAPNIGPALFGAVSIDAFDQAMYWASLAKDYAPPGLLPRETPGPKRARAAGTTVHFVQQAVYPRFLLRKGSLTLSLGSEAGGARGEYRLTATDVTSEPMIVGRPMRFTLDRAAAGSVVESFAATATLDHTKRVPHSLIEVRAGGVRLPTFPLPATPLRADLGRGQSTMRLSMNGDSVVGTWTISAPNAAWTIDSAQATRLNMMERLVTRVIQSIQAVDVNANVAGTMHAPRLTVRSNLDRAVADGIRSVVGEEVAKAEVKVRAQVDSAAERALAPVRARAAELRADVDQRAKDASTRLEEAKRQLAAQLKTLGAGLLGGP